MLKAYIIAVIVVAWASGEAATAYLKGWEDGEAPEVLFYKLLSSSKRKKKSFFYDFFFKFMFRKN